MATKGNAVAGVAFCDILWDVLKIDGSLARNIDFGVANFQFLRKTRRKTSILKLQCQNWRTSRTECSFWCSHVSRLESLVFLWPRGVCGGSCKKLLSFPKVSKQVVMSFCVAVAALRDIQTCFVSRRKSFCDFCGAVAILLRRFRKMRAAKRVCGKKKLQFRGQAQNFGDLYRHCAWQGQHFRPLRTPRSALYTPHFTLYTSHSTLYIPHFTLHTLHFTLHTPPLHFTLNTLHFTLFTSHPALYTLTLHSTLHTPYFTLYTNTSHCTVRSSLHTLDCTLYTLHSTLHTLHSTLHTLHISPLHTLHSTLYTFHSALHTLHFTRCTSHFTFLRVYDVSLSTRFGIRTTIISVSIRVRGLHLVFHVLRLVECGMCWVMLELCIEEFWRDHSQQTWRFHHRNGDAANITGSTVKDLSTLGPRGHDFLLVGSRSDVPSLVPFLQEASLENRGFSVNPKTSHEN